MKSVSTQTVQTWFYKFESYFQVYNMNYINIQRKSSKLSIEFENCLALSRTVHIRREVSAAAWVSFSLSPRFRSRRFKTSLRNFLNFLNFSVVIISSNCLQDQRVEVSFLLDCFLAGKRNWLNQFFLQNSSSTCDIYDIYEFWVLGRKPNRSF